MFLDDLARGARRKGVAAAREVRAGHRLGDRAPLGGEGDVLRVDIVAIGRGRGRRGGARAGHAKDAEHIADAVGHRDHRRQAPRLRLRDRLREHAFDVGGGQRRDGGRGVEPARRRGRRGRCWDGCRGRRSAAAAAARGEQQRSHRSKGGRTEKRGLASHDLTAAPRSRAPRCRTRPGIRTVYRRWDPSPPRKRDRCHCGCPPPRRP